jgi:hypothetical protein
MAALQRQTSLRCNRLQQVDIGGRIRLLRFFGAEAHESDQLVLEGKRQQELCFELLKLGAFGLGHRRFAIHPGIGIVKIHPQGLAIAPELLHRSRGRFETGAGRLRKSHRMRQLIMPVVLDQYCDPWNMHGSRNLPGHRFKQRFSLHHGTDLIAQLAQNFLRVISLAEKSAIQPPT